jgi:hypothetical protein
MVLLYEHELRPISRPQFNNDTINALANNNNLIKEWRKSIDDIENAVSMILNDNNDNDNNRNANKKYNGFYDKKIFNIVNKFAYKKNSIKIKNETDKYKISFQMLKQYYTMLFEKTQESILILQSIITSLEMENREIKEKFDIMTQANKLDTDFNPDIQCSICMDQPKTHAYTECGHLCACQNCAIRIGTTCPICREYSTYIKIIR